MPPDAAVRSRESAGARRPVEQRVGQAGSAARARVTPSPAEAAGDLSGHHVMWMFPCAIPPSGYFNLLTAAAAPLRSCGSMPCVSHRFKSASISPRRAGCPLAMATSFSGTVKGI